jgi:hypothetical protein
MVFGSLETTNLSAPTVAPSATAGFAARSAMAR